MLRKATSKVKQIVTESSSHLSHESLFLLIADSPVGEWIAKVALLFEAT